MSYINGRSLSRIRTISRAVAITEFDGVGLPSGVEKASKRELEKRVLRVLALGVAIHLIHVFVALAGQHIAGRAVGVKVILNFIEVRGVRLVLDLRRVGRRLFAKLAAKVNALEKGVPFDLIAAVPPEPLLRSATQLQYQIRRVGREVPVLRYPQCFVPMDHLFCDKWITF
jgi:hypothetical protein